MARTHFAIPGDLAAPTGGYAYDRRLLAALDLVHLPLPAGFPHPDDEVLARTHAALAAVPPADVLLIDGLAFGALPEDIVRSIPCPVVALVHHPLSLETGLSAARAAALAASETAALGHARAVVTTSRATARLLAAEYGVDENRLHVAVPGTEHADRATGSGSGAPHLLAVGSLVPRKGYGDLIDALAMLADLDWRLEVAGSDAFDPHHADALRARAARLGIGGRCHFAGAMSQDALNRAYGAADAFVCASLYEGFGMAITEALARGLPIVTTACGAATELLPPQAALVVPPGHPAALADALRRMVGDDKGRRVMAEAGWQAARRLPTWDETAQHVAAALQEPGA